MLYKYVFGTFRTVLGIALLGSVLWQVLSRIGAGLFRPAEYFSFFSITSSILAGLILLFSGSTLFFRRTESDTLMTLRLVATVSMVIVGVVYHALLGDSAVDPRDIGYVWPVVPNLVIHTWAPIAIVIDYLLSVKGSVPRWRKSLWVVVYPLTWLGFSIIRGLLDGWWPYWFINPNSEIGLAGVIGYVSTIAVAFIVLGFLISGLRIILVKLTVRS